jgi:hypothetical protein
MKIFASFFAWSKCCYGCEMASKKYIAQVLCVVLGYNFNFQFQEFIDQV